jgi:hypothetical protein
LEETTTYIVEITPEAEFYFYEILAYLYKYHSELSADKKSSELLDLAISLEIDPQRGAIEDNLLSLGKNHKFLLYYYTLRKAIKIIYFVDEPKKIVYITDFFPCQMDDRKINKRTKR